MSEKKKIDFISGTAFLLSILALFLIGINAIQGTPSEEALQQAMEEQFAGFSQQLDVQLQAGVKQLDNLKSELRHQRVMAMRQVLESLQKDAPADLQEHVARVDAALTELENAMAASEASVEEAVEPTPVEKVEEAVVEPVEEAAPPTEE